MASVGASCSALLWAVVFAACVGCGSDGPSGPPPAPRITSVLPTPVRAGETLTIRGRDFPVRDLQVWIDGATPLEPTGATPSELVITIPLSLAAGDHTIHVQTNTTQSNTVSITSEIFTVTGTYAGEGTLARDPCGIRGDSLGRVRPVEISLTDNRPALSVTMDTLAVPLALQGRVRFQQGSLAGDGSFNATSISTGTTVVRFSGNMVATPEGIAGFSGQTSELVTFGSGIPGCEIIETIVAERGSTIPTLRVPYFRTLTAEVYQIVPAILNALHER
jgi:hypothetical protein